MSSIYRLNTAPTGVQQIVDADSVVLINIFNPAHFTPDQGELQFYADDRGRYLVFETDAWESNGMATITAALTWYADHIGNPALDISIKPLRVVRS